MRIFAMADLHLSFGADKPMDVFGSRWSGHAERIRDNWNMSVDGSDAVIISGDVSWGLKLEEAMPDLKWIHELHGRKIFTKGNHDLWWTSVTKLNRLYSDMIFLQNTIYDLSTEDKPRSICVCGSRGWILPQHTAEWTEHDDKILNRELIRVKLSLDEAKAANFQRIIVSLHYPPLDADGSDSCFTELIERYNVTDVVYGHLHGEDAERKAFSGEKNGIKYRLVSSDALRFRPYLVVDADDS